MCGPCLDSVVVGGGGGGGDGGVFVCVSRVRACVRISELVLCGVMVVLVVVAVVVLVVCVCTCVCRACLRISELV